MGSGGYKAVYRDTSPAVAPATRTCFLEPWADM